MLCASHEGVRGCSEFCVSAGSSRMEKQMALDKDLIDKLLEGYQKPEDLIGENGLLKQLAIKRIAI